jgi:hypothetical protein
VCLKFDEKATKTVWNKESVNFKTRNYYDTIIVTGFFYDPKELIVADEEGKIVQDIKRLGSVEIDISSI